MLQTWNTEWQHDNKYYTNDSLCEAKAIKYSWVNFVGEKQTKMLEYTGSISLLMEVILHLTTSSRLNVRKQLLQQKLENLFIGFIWQLWQLQQSLIKSQLKIWNRMAQQWLFLKVSVVLIINNFKKRKVAPWELVERLYPKSISDPIFPSPLTF